MTNFNEYPIIGVLAQETSYQLEKCYPGRYKSFIAASYVKFVEGGGSRVVPIFIGKPKQYYVDIMQKINGILFPGGATYFDVSNGYSDAGMYIYEIAKEMNDRGEYFPLWGTCLGFELLTYVDYGRIEHRTDCSSHNQPLNLEFKQNFRESKLFSNAPEEILKDLKDKPITYNYHQYCVTEKTLCETGLSGNWRVMSTNKDWDGLEFISTMEHFKYPFYGVQFHPEKHPYEWIRDRNISHTKEANRAAQYFAEFFVDECRKSRNCFSKGVKEENSYVIYNFPATFTGKEKSVYEQCYLFDENVDYRRVEFTVSEILGIGIILMHGLRTLYNAL
ncbi:gamma-glutamyl hydrolase-like [Culicoides brevitarsis]|uniref:gamma-glutamyl hydrolase-like n=1 Tax=Culicoides brevitarsis TaxID=469753 RepID=UPI00307C300D